MSSAPTSKSIGHGSTVTMHYSLLLEDGTVVDSTFDTDEPLTFTLGDGTLVQGLEYALVDLKPGDQQSINIGPEEGFGYPDPAAVQTMQRKEFSETMELKPGVIIEFDTPSGLQVPGMVKEVKDDTVTVDFSHPLAGHTVTFNVKILDVQ
ncbi:MAG: FKBP-type peptidyl-prolyl cis-trans isomerase [Gammaproteobacteria bacterium]|jgi:FKBP-type peptidyl-prolyl cis-trans isomerase SlpA